MMVWEEEQIKEKMIIHKTLFGSWFRFFSKNVFLLIRFLGFWLSSKMLVQSSNAYKHKEDLVEIL
jgi:hypothetical protein